MDLNIAIDAGNVTGGLDGAVSALERIKRLVESTEPFGSHLAKGSKVEVDGMMAQMRRLVNGVEGDMKRVASALKGAAPKDMREELQRTLAPMRQLVTLAAELSKAKFSGMEGAKAADEVRKVVTTVQQLADAYDRLTVETNQQAAAAQKAAAKTAQANLQAKANLDAQLRAQAATVQALRQKQPADMAATAAVAGASLAGARDAASQAASLAVLGAQQDRLNKFLGVGEAATRKQSVALKQHTGYAKDLHSAYRGLASGFGAMWLTWGNALPLLSGAAISHGLVNAVRMGAELGHTLNTIGALGEVGAAGVAKLNDAALELGKTGVHGPREISEALKSLALAGLSVEDQLKGLPAVLDFSIAGERPLKDAAEDLVAISTAFGKGSDQFRYVGDVISKTAAASMASTTDMSAAFRTASTIATTYRVSLEDVALGLGMMAQAGIRGQAAGTGLRQMYVELTGATESSRKALKALNIDIFDDLKGQVKDLPEIVNSVAKALKGLDFSAQMDVLNKITNERGMRALGIFLQGIATEAERSGESVESAMDRMQKAVADSAGFMGGAAKQMADDTAGDFKRIAAALETDLVSAFQIAEPEVRALLQSIHDLLATNPALIEGLAALIGNVATLANEVLTLDTSTVPLIGTFGSFGDMMNDAAAIALVTKTSVAQLVAEVRVALAQLAALVAFDFSAIPKFKAVHDADTDARRAELQSKLQALKDRGREQRERKEAQDAIKAIQGSALAASANAGLDEWIKKNPPQARPRGGGAGTRAAPDLGGGRARKAAKPEADENRRVEQATANLQKLKDEYQILSSFPAAYDKMTQSEKDLYLVKQQLTSGIDANGRAYTKQETAARQALKTKLEESVEYEKANKMLLDHIEARKKLEEASKKWVEDTQIGNEELQAQVDNFGKSKEAIEMLTLQRMKDAAATGETVKVGKQELIVSEAAIKAQQERIDLMQQLNALSMKQKFDEDIASARDRMDMANEELKYVGMTSLERAKAVALAKAELQYRKEIRDIEEQLEKKGITHDAAEDLRRRARNKKEIEGQAAVQEAIVDDFVKTADSINQSLTDALLRGFEDGKGFGKNFADTLKNMFKTLVLRPVISFIVQPIGNAISGVVTNLLGGLGGQGGGAGNLLGTASNMQSAYQWLSGGYQDTFRSVANFLGFGGSAATPAVGYGGQALTGLTWGGKPIASSPLTGFSGTPLSQSSWLSSAATGLAVVAAPLLIGALAESRSRDRFSGAAFATSNFGKDPTVTIGGAEYDPIKGILPDRDALVGRALEAGISQEMIDRFKGKDRALLHYIRMLDSNRQSGNEGPPINVNALLENDNMYAADWYRGQGYAHPQAMGWWNDKGYDLVSNDPAITTASRAVATSIVAPLTEINRILGGAAEDFRVTAGYATRGEGKGVWAGLNVTQGENTLLDWVNMDDYHSPQEALRGMYTEAMGVFEKLDLPDWAKKQVDGAQAQLAALTGDKVGEQAAAIFSQATAGIAQMYQSIKLLITVFPDFRDATQDSVFALQELMGGMQNLQSAYSSYMQNFWGDEERKNLARKQLRVQLADAGFEMPDIEAMKGDESRRWFRAQVEAQDLSTESGRKAFAALMGLADAFAQLTPAMEAATDAAADAADAQRKLQETYGAAKSRTDQVWSRLKELFNEQIDNWKKLADEARAIFDMASTAARELRNEVPSTLEYTAAQSNSFIDQALAGLRATGALPEADSLRLAIDGARGGLSMDNYASVAEFERDKLILAGKLGEIGDAAGVQMTFAEQQVKLLQDQMDYWRKQIDLLRNTDLSLSSINEGVTALADALRAEQAAQAALEAAKNPAGGGSGGSGGASFGGGGSGSGGRTPAQIAAEAEALKGKDWWGNGDWSKLVGASLAAAASAIGVKPEDLATYLQGEGLQVGNGTIIPRFAAGGAHAGGLRLVGERGPELEVTGPARYWNFDQTSAMFGGGNVEGLLMALLDAMREANREARIQTDNSDQQLSLFKRVTDNGEHMKTMEPAA